jgi:Lipocalin-like domain
MAEHIRQKLLGAWELVSWQSIGQDGVIGYPLGEDAVGQLMYDGASNRVSAQLVRRHQPRFASDDWQEASPDEMVAAWPSYFGYFGSFTIDTDEEAVTHHIEAAWFPNLAATDQVRPYRFEGEQLVLDADTAWGQVRIVWRKLTD